MYIDEKKRENFIEIMKGVAEKHGCHIQFETRSNDIDFMRIRIAKGFRQSEFTIHWSRVKSLTDISVDLWSMFFSAAPNSVDDYCMTIKDVIFNAPATIVFWMDGTKTVVKCQEDDIFDPEKGLAMAIAKKAMGNKGNYCNEFKKWLPEDKYEDVPCLYPTLPELPKDFGKKLAEIIDERIEAVKKKIAAGDT